MAAQIRSLYRTILQKIKDKLIADLSWEDHQVVISQRAINFNVQGDRYIILRSQNPQFNTSVYHAAGRVDTEMGRLLQVHVRTRLSFDEPDRDENHLLDATEGHFLLEDSVLDTLVGFGPVDDEQNFLTVCPLEPMTGVDVFVDEKIDPHWTESIFIFKVEHVQDLDQNVVF